MGEFVRDRLPDPVSYFESQGLSLKGPGNWRTTRCAFHDGSDSMRVNTQTGGWVCMACGESGGDVLAYHMASYGLDFVAAARELGAYQDDGRPHRGHLRRATLPAGAALEVLAPEAMIIGLIGCDVHSSRALSDADHARLLVAVGRVSLIASEVSR